MSEIQSIEFIDNPAVNARREHYMDVTIDVAKVLESFRGSLYAYEWMLSNGRIKSRDELPEHEQPKCDEAEQKMKSGKALEKPVLGIGLIENVEIGSGRAIFMTLAAAGVKTMPVHIPKSNEDEFKPFLS